MSGIPRSSVSNTECIYWKGASNHLTLGAYQIKAGPSLSFLNGILIRVDVSEKSAAGISIAAV